MAISGRPTRFLPVAAVAALLAIALSGCSFNYPHGFSLGRPPGESPRHGEQICAELAASELAPTRCDAWVGFGSKGKAFAVTLVIEPSSVSADQVQEMFSAVNAHHDSFGIDVVTIHVYNDNPDSPRTNYLEDVLMNGPAREVNARWGLDESTGIAVRPAFDSAYMSVATKRLPGLVKNWE
ncbi:hypothetical protein [Leucobacter komagatae]|uniref:hypothetical protein n=1 Tax=Leucobacter komagatae TaxID=55969 RepID=UPI0012ED58F3|nr:hypothetical protein [Leucobacter komagatae]